MVGNMEKMMKEENLQELNKICNDFMTDKEFTTLEVLAFYCSSVSMVISHLPSDLRFVDHVCETIKMNVESYKNERKED